MKRKVDRNKLREYLFTFLVAACSVPLLYFSVSTLQQNQDVQTVLNLNKKQYAICMRYHDVTVSFLEVVLLSEEIDSLVFKGRVSSSSDTPHTFTAQLSFNPLFQLYTAFLKIQMFDEYDFELKLNGVKISELLVAFKKSDMEIFSSSMEIPGPILMSKKSDTDENFEFSVLLPSRLLARSDIMNNEITKVSELFPSRKYLSKDFSYSEVDSTEQCPLDALPEDLNNLDHRFITSIEKTLSGMFHKSS
jgi:hypothetical protein